MGCRERLATRRTREPSPTSTYLVGTLDQGVMAYVVFEDGPGGGLDLRCRRMHEIQSAYRQVEIGASSGAGMRNVRRGRIHRKSHDGECSWQADGGCHL